jgi:hypothetical protein
MSESSQLLETLVLETQRPEAEILALALQAGLRQLWREHVLSRYLCEEITREEAAASVGPHWVELAERQHDALAEDLAWALETESES